MRSWKQYYTVLSGPLLNFYKDKKDFQQVHTSNLDNKYIHYLVVYSSCPPFSLWSLAVCIIKDNYMI